METNPEENDEPLLCHLCQRSFTRSYNLRRHIDSVHLANGNKNNELSDDSNLFECDKCTRTFRRKDTLVRHIRVQHNGKLYFECYHCNVKFSSKKILRRHIRGISHVLKKNWICDHCDKSFGKSFNLKRHVASIHKNISEHEDSPQNSFLMCDVCKKVFNRKDNLKVHISIAHNFDRTGGNSYDEYKCHICGKVTKYRSCLVNHVASHGHGGGNPRGPRLKCLKCKELFFEKCNLNRHYEDEHGIALKDESFEFSSLEKLNDWRKKLQRETITYFRNTHTWVTAYFIVKEYWCHRSGTYQKKSENGIRKRELKLGGSKKLQGYCPAMIMTRERRDDGRCFVTMQKTHVGHPVADPNELRYIFKNTRVKIAKLKDGDAPLDLIMESENFDEECSRCDISDTNDVEEIDSNSHILDLPACLTDGGTVDAATLLEDNAESILYYKNMGEEDTTFGIFNKHDFIIIFMNERQEHNLRLYGHNVVAFDGSCRLNSRNFILHTLFVLNVECEGLPSAFLLSNRNDQRVIDIFVKCVRNRVGVIKAKTFMSDGEDSYLNSWIRVMEAPEKRLICAWHVRKDWRQNLGRISVAEKREEIGRKLNELADELGEGAFKEKLVAFMSTVDDDVKEFVEYFRDNYSTNTKEWAYCYRAFCGVNTNTHGKAFQRGLRRLIGDGGAIENVSDGLLIIYQYLKIVEYNSKATGIRGKITHKLAALRRIHRSVEGKVFIVENVDSESWQVGVCEEAENVVEMYVVCRVKSAECCLYGESCRLRCSSCDSCFHEYRCPCMDCAIRNNMCKHIHVLCIYLKNSRSYESQVKEETGGVVCNVVDCAQTEDVEHFHR